MATEQVTPPKDMNRNPTGKGGFQEHPENRSPGGWKKEESISYQYNRLMRMSPTELGKFEPKTVAQMIAHTRLKQATKLEGLPDAKEITDRTEGKAPQQLDMTSKGESINPYAGLTLEELRKLAGS